MLPKANAMMLVGFVIPVLCCLIGAGAFAMLTAPEIAPDLADERVQMEKIREYQEIADALRAQVDEMTAAVERLREEADRKAEQLRLIERMTEQLAQVESVLPALAASAAGTDTLLQEAQQFMAGCQTLRKGETSDE